MAINIDTNIKKINQILTRGVEEIIDVDNLKKGLKSGKQLRVKLGIDPTSPNIHIGRAIPLFKLRDFQELGHKIILIIMSKAELCSFRRALLISSFAHLLTLIPILAMLREAKLLVDCWASSGLAAVLKVAFLVIFC